MALFPWQATVQDGAGNSIAAATVTVRDGGPGGALSSIFTDSTGTTAKSNPFNASADGFAQFWAAAGTYYIEGTDVGQTTDGWYVVLGGGGGAATVTLAATVAQGEAVAADGTLVTEATADEYIGIATESGISGDEIAVQRFGEYTLSGWTWTPGEYVYLTDAGALTQAAPSGTHRRIGIATASDTIALAPGLTVTEVGGSGNENYIPALNEEGFLAASMFDNVAIANQVSDSSENQLIRTDANGLIDSSFLPPLTENSETGATPTVDFSNDYYEIVINAENCTISFSGEDTIDEVTVILSFSPPGYDLGNISYVQSYDVTGETTSIAGGTISENGTKAIVIDDNNSRLIEYNFGTSYDLSTLTSGAGTLDYSSQATDAYSCNFADNGNIIFIGADSGFIHKYNLSTPYAIGTATYDTSQDMNSLSTLRSDVIKGIYFNSNGTKMFVGYGFTDYVDIGEYSLSTPYDPTSATEDDLVELFMQTTGSNLATQCGFDLSADGSNLFIADPSRIIYSYSLSTPFDMSTATDDSEDTSLTANVDKLRQISVVNSGTRLYVFGENSTNARIFEYTIEPTLTVTWPTSLIGGNLLNVPAIGKYNVYTIFTLDGGTTHYLKNINEGLE